MPIDLTSVKDLEDMTSGWLTARVFDLLREKRHNSRSQSLSKVSTDIQVSEDGSVLEPVSLSTRNRVSESVDYFLTLKNEPIVNFLAPEGTELQVNFISRLEMEEEWRNKSQGRVPTFRDFEFIKVLGKGGFATVYMVRKRSSGMLYALKTVKKASVKQNDTRFQQVLRERNILSQLKNPFLVQLHYAFQTKNYYCLVIDLCTGGELFYYLQKYQSFKLSQAKLLFAEVVCAMEFLHQNNILYRDLKPENILVDESGHLKLTDFGLCKAAFSRSDLATSFVGSPEYMSPEILLGHPYNFSVDFYTLGVLLYEMIVGLPPFYNEDKMKMYRDISYAPLSIPSILKGSIRDLLSGLLQKDPRYRLGCKRGISEIKEHSFFSDIDWNALSRKQTPIAGSRPPIDVNIFESNFDTEYTSMPIEIKPLDEEVITVQDPIQTVAPFRRRCNSFSYSLKLVQRSLKPSGADLHKYSSRKMEKVDRTPMKVMQQLDFQLLLDGDQKLSKKDISLSQLIPAEANKKLHFPLQKQQSDKQKIQVGRQLMELDDISVKPHISRSILSPTEHANFDKTPQSQVITSPNHQLFNYRKNTILTEDEDTDGKTELQFQDDDLDLKFDEDEFDTSPKKKAKGEISIIDENSKLMVNPTVKFAMNNQKKKVVQLKFPKVMKQPPVSVSSVHNETISSTSSVPFLSHYMAKNEHIMRFKMFHEEILQEPEIKSLRVTETDDRDVNFDTDQDRSVEVRKTPTQISVSIKLQQDLHDQRITEVDEGFEGGVFRNSESYVPSQDETQELSQKPRIPVLKTPLELSENGDFPEVYDCRVVETVEAVPDWTYKHIAAGNATWEVDQEYGFSQDFQDSRQRPKHKGIIFKTANPQLIDQDPRQRTSSVQQQKQSFISIVRESPRLLFADQTISNLRKPFFPNLDSDYNNNHNAFEHDSFPAAFDQYASETKRGTAKGLKEINLDDTKTQKLLRFTELAAGVVSERARLPLEPDQQTLEYKLYQEEDENEIETNSDERNVLTKNQLISKFLEQKIKSLYPTRVEESLDQSTTILNDIQKRPLNSMVIQKDFSAMVHGKLLRNDSEIKTPKDSFLESDSGSHDAAVTDNNSDSQRLNSVQITQTNQTPLLTEVIDVNKTILGRSGLKSSLNLPRRPANLKKTKTQASPQKLIKLMQLANMQGLDAQIAASLRVKPIFAYQQKGNLQQLLAQKSKVGSPDKVTKEQNFNLVPIQTGPINQPQNLAAQIKPLYSARDEKMSSHSRVASEDQAPYDPAKGPSQSRTGRQNLNSSNSSYSRLGASKPAQKQQPLSTAENTYFIKTTRDHRGSQKKAQPTTHKKNSSLGSLLETSKKNSVSRGKKTEFRSQGKVSESSQGYSTSKVDRMFRESPVRFEPMGTPNNECTLLKHNNLFAPPNSQVQAKYTEPKAFKLASGITQGQRLVDDRSALDLEFDPLLQSSFPHTQPLKAQKRQNIGDFPAASFMWQQANDAIFSSSVEEQKAAKNGKAIDQFRHLTSTNLGLEAGRRAELTHPTQRQETNDSDAKALNGHKVKEASPMQGIFRSVTDLGCQLSALQDKPMTQPLTNSYEKDFNSSFNIAETSVEELNFMDSEVYDDMTYKDGEETSQDVSQLHNSESLTNLAVTPTLRKSAHKRIHSDKKQNLEQILLSETSLRQPKEPKHQAPALAQSKEPKKIKPAEKKFAPVTSPKDKKSVTKKHMVQSTKKMSFNFQGAKAELTANSNIKKQSGLKTKRATNFQRQRGGIFSPDFEKTIKPLITVGPALELELSQSYNLSHRQTKSQRRRSGAITPSSNLRQNTAGGFQAKTSFTATASIKTSNVSEGKSSVCNVFAQARDTLAPLNSDHQLDDFNQSRHIIATLSAGASAMHVTSIDYGKEMNSSKFLHSRTTSKNQSTLAQMIMPKQIHQTRVQTGPISLASDQDFVLNQAPLNISIRLEKLDQKRRGEAELCLLSNEAHRFEEGKLSPQCKRTHSREPQSREGLFGNLGIISKDYRTKSMVTIDGRRGSEYDGRLFTLKDESPQKQQSVSLKEAGSPAKAFSNTQRLASSFQAAGHRPLGLQGKGKVPVSSTIYKKINVTIKKGDKVSWK